MRCHPTFSLVTARHFSTLNEECRGALHRIRVTMSRASACDRSLTEKQQQLLQDYLKRLENHHPSDMNTLKRKIIQKHGMEQDLNSIWDTRFMKACAQNELDVVKNYIEQGVDVNRTKNGRPSVLMIAAQNSDWTSSLDMVKLLVESGANVACRVTWPNDYTLLQTVCVHTNTTSSLETAQYLVSTLDPDDVTRVVSKVNIDAIVKAVIDNESTIETLRFLLQHGMSTHVKRNNKTTILRAMCDEWKDYIVQCDNPVRLYALANTLLSFSADTLATLTWNGMNAFGIFFRYGGTWHNMKRKQTLWLLDNMVAAGVDINHRWVLQNSGTVLMRITDTNACLETMEWLLKHGADPNVQNVGGGTALTCITTVEQAELLLRYGADMNVVDNQGHSILYYLNATLREYFAARGISLAFDSYNAYPFIHLKAVYAQLQQELCDILKTGVETPRAAMGEVPQELGPRWNLHKVPYIRLPDALQLYIHGVYPRTHPLYEKVAPTKGAIARGCNKERMLKYKKRILVTANSIAHALHLHTRTTEGQKRLRAIAEEDISGVTFVLPDPSGNNDNSAIKKHKCNDQDTQHTHT